jgi:hypothetical protein
MRVPYRAAYFVLSFEQPPAALTGPGDMRLTDGDLIEAGLLAAQRSRMSGVPWRLATPVQILGAMYIDSDEHEDYCWKVGSWWNPAGVGDLDAQAETYWLRHGWRSGVPRPSRAVDVCAALMSFGYRCGKVTRRAWNERSRLLELKHQEWLKQEERGNSPHVGPLRTVLRFLGRHYIGRRDRAK